MYVLGIDPGLDGGFCVISKNGIVDVLKTPTCNRHNRKGRYIDIDKIYNFISKYQYSEYKKNNEYVHAVYIERQFILRSQGMSSGSKTMYQAGILYGLCWSLYNVEEINAKEWQEYIFPQVDLTILNKYNFANDTKLKSIGYVEQYYNKDYLFYSKRQTKPSDGLADAICIASTGLHLLTNKNT